MNFLRDNRKVIRRILVAYLFLLLVTCVAYSGLNITFLAFLPFFVLWCGFVLAPIFAILLFLIGTRYSAVQGRTTEWAFTILMVSCFALPLPWVGSKLSDLRVRATMERADPIITALSQYTNKQGYPPEKLDDLIPRYLPAIPSMGIMCPINYRRSNENWTISIHEPNPSFEDYISWEYANDFGDYAWQGWPSRRVGRYTWTKRIYD